MYNPKTIKQIAREYFKTNDKEIEKELAKKMINPYYFIDRIIKIGFNINLESHNNNHAASILTSAPNFPEFGIDSQYIFRIMKEMATIYARLKNQHKFKYHTLFSASFCKINEKDQRSDENELLNNLNINHNSTETDINNIDVKSQLEHQIQI